MRRKPKYTVDEIRQRVAPVARRYGVKHVFLFGSYARDEARAKSDVDLLIDDPENKIKGLFALGGLYCDLEEALGAKIDLFTTDALSEKFSNRIRKEEVLLYAEGA